MRELTEERLALREEATKKMVASFGMPNGPEKTAVIEEVEELLAKSLGWYVTDRGRTWRNDEICARVVQEEQVGWASYLEIPGKDLRYTTTTGPIEGITAVELLWAQGQKMADQMDDVLRSLATPDPRAESRHLN